MLRRRRLPPTSCAAKFRPSSLLLLYHMYSVRRGRRHEESGKRCPPLVSPRCLLSRHCRWSIVIGRRVLGKLLCQPEIVMLLGPVEVDLTRAHGFERAFHPQGADIN